jgi:hypothetical protein
LSPELKEVAVAGKTNAVRPPVASGIVLILFMLQNAAFWRSCLERLRPAYASLIAFAPTCRFLKHFQFLNRFN